MDGAKWPSPGGVLSGGSRRRARRVASSACAPAASLLPGAAPGGGGSGAPSSAAASGVRGATSGVRGAAELEEEEGPAAASAGFAVPCHDAESHDVEHADDRHLSLGFAPDLRRNCEAKADAVSARPNIARAALKSECPTWSPNPRCSRPPWRRAHRASAAHAAQAPQSPWTCRASADGEGAGEADGSAAPNVLGATTPPHRRLTPSRRPCLSDS